MTRTKTIPATLAHVLADLVQVGVLEPTKGATGLAVTGLGAELLHRHVNDDAEDQHEALEQLTMPNLKWTLAQ